MVKNIIFDMGNVLVNYSPVEFVKRFTDNQEHQKLLVYEIFQSVEWVQYDRGILTTAELAKQVCGRIPDFLHTTVFEIVNKWYEEIKPIPEMEKLIQTLKKNRYNLYLLSNASADYYTFKDIVPGISYFDGTFISSDWKLVKPDKEIYKAFCTHFNLTPSECYFIDDTPANIESAIHFGMKGFLFRGEVGHLLESLEKNGIQTT